MESLTKKVATNTTIIKTNPTKLESYEWNIKIFSTFIDPNAISESVNIADQIFSSGSLLHPFKNGNARLSGTIYRHTRQLKISFRLPSKFGNVIFKMRPFTVDFMAQGKILSSLESEFSATKLQDARWISQIYFNQHYLYNVFLDLPHLDSDLFLDNIRVTFCIAVEEEPTSCAGKNDSTIIPELQHPLTNLKFTMGQFFNSEYLSDFTVFCEDESYFAHRFVLSVASPVFQKMFESDTKEKEEKSVVIQDLNKTTVALLLEWMYTGEMVEADVLDFQNTLDLFKAAHKYCMDPLKNWCASQITENHANVDNALQIFIMGHTYEETFLMDKSKEIIKSEKRQIFQDREVYKEFLEMYPDFMHELFVQ